MTEQIVRTRVIAVVMRWSSGHAQETGASLAFLGAARRGKHLSLQVCSQEKEVKKKKVIKQTICFLTRNCLSASPNLHTDKRCGQTDCCYLGRSDGR